MDIRSGVIGYELAIEGIVDCSSRVIRGDRTRMQSRRAGTKGVAYGRDEGQSQSQTFESVGYNDDQLSL